MRGICISENMPSCMRAPPDAVKMMKGGLVLDGAEHAGDDGFARRHAERAAQKFEILHRDRHLRALQGADGEPDGVIGSGFGAIILEPVGIALDVAEFQRVGGTSGGGRLS